MSLLDIPPGTDVNELKKRINILQKKARDRAKPDHCILCGQKQTSFCNSHSVPQMVLNKIGKNGQIVQSNALFGLEILKDTDGINRSGTFHIICRECDNNYFKDYENPEALRDWPTNKMLAEIALKDSLLQLAKRQQEITMLEIAQADYRDIYDYEFLIAVKQLDEKELNADIGYYKDIINNEKSWCFQILYRNVLPYEVPIATQSMFVLMEDLKGYRINNVFDFSPNVRMQYLHLCVFPLESQSLVLLFCGKRDRNYRTLKAQIKARSDDENLRYINWLIFKYTENYFFNSRIEPELKEYDLLQELSHENSGVPNMGYIDENFWLHSHKLIGVDEIPNFLDQSHSSR